MWTTENTEGFSRQDLDTINAVLDRIAADAAEIDPANINDAINNAWIDGIGEAELEAATRRRLGLAWREDILHDRQNRSARDEFRKVQCTMPASHFAQHIPAK